MAKTIESTVTRLTQAERKWMMGSEHLNKVKITATFALGRGNRFYYPISQTNTNKKPFS